MSDSVKMVFKALLGTIFIMVMSSVCIELFNINITGLQIRYMVKMAAKQSAMLFTQETYKIDEGGGAVKASTIKDADGNIYISGDFYGSTKARTIYNNIYGSDDFKNWCSSGAGAGKSFKSEDGKTTYYISRTPNGKPMEDTYNAVAAMKIATSNSYESFLSSSKNVPSWDDGEDSDKVKKWNLYNLAKSYDELLYTPINVGIPYLDATIMNKIFKWNTAQLMSNCDPDLIQSDESGEKFINYKGFRIYAKDAVIKSYQYAVYDLRNSSDRDAFTALTDYKVIKGSSSGSTSTKAGIRYNVDAQTDIEKQDNYAAVVSIQYDLPISYEGITPIKKIFNYVWGKEVAGFDGTEGAEITDAKGKHQQWDDTRQSITSGHSYKANSGKSAGYNENKADYKDVMFTTGYLTYTIIN